MSRKETYRGLILEVGEKGLIGDTIRGRRMRFLGGAVLLTLSFGPLLLTGTPYFAPENPFVPGFVVVLAMALLPVLIFSILNLQSGLQMDCIYENGTTNRRSTLVDIILRRSFAPFQEIKVIGHGREPFEGKDVAFVGLMTEDGSPLLPPFVDSGYKNDFFDFLVTQSKKRCPDAEWLEISWQDLG